MYQPKDFFRAGLKIIGVLTILWVFTQAVQVIVQFYSIYNQPELMAGDVLSQYRFSLIFQILIPVLLLVIGTYLLRNGDAVVQFAFRDSNEKQNGSIDTLFVLFMKLAGLGLIIYAIPETLQLISNATFAATVRGIDIHPQTDFIILHLASTLVKLLLGFYLLISGKIFYKLGFPDTQE